MLALGLCFVITSVARSQNKESRPLDNFNSLQVAEGIEVILHKGQSPQARVNTGNIDLDDVVTEVRNNQLKIYLRGSFQKHVEVSIDLTYVHLNEINLNSAAHLKAAEPIQSDRLDIQVSSAADGKLTLAVNQLNVDVSSAGSLTVSGHAVSQKVSVNSAAKFHAGRLVAERAEIDVGSAGTAQVNVSEFFEGKANSAGKIKYSGDPKKVHVSSNSGGKIRKESN